MTGRVPTGRCTKKPRPGQAEIAAKAEPLPPPILTFEDDYELGDICRVMLSFQCKSCTFLSHDKRSLQKHFREFHSNENSVKVVVGLQPSGEDRDLDKEDPPDDGEEEAVFLCSECNIIFSSEEACCSHMVNIHGLESFSAAMAREDRDRGRQEEERKRKRPARHVKPPLKYSLEGGVVVPSQYRVSRDSCFFRCAHCNSKFESIEVAKFHEQCHALKATGGTSNKGFLCFICSAVPASEGSSAATGTGTTSNLTLTAFDSWGKCAWHLWKEHRIDCDLNSCSHPGCEYKSYFSTKVKEHEGIHSEVPSFKCDTCQKCFKQLKQLRTHEKYHKERNTRLPPPVDSRWYTSKECPICKRVLSDSKCLKKHISAVHNKLKPYLCNICGHTSARKAELQLHTRQHTGEKPFKCDMCPFSTGDHNSLRNHKRTHTKSSIYACKFCSFRCIQSSSFKKHVISLHPEEDSTVFVCPYCPLISVNGEKYQGHVQDHVEGRVPIIDMDPQNGSSSSAPPPATASTVLSSTETGITAVPGPSLVPTDTRPASILKPPEYWLREDEPDLVDTGGITIPAPEAEPASRMTDAGMANE